MGGLANTVSMSGLTVAIITVAALVVCIFLGEKLKSNIGVLALIAASILGIFVFGMRPSAIYTYWPISITLQMIVVIFFYGFAIANGTAQYMADWAIYAARKVPALLPFIFFVVDFGMMAIGINPGAVTVFLVPIFMQICYKSKVSEMVIMAGHCLALGAGCTSPIGSVGIIIRGLFDMFGFEGQGSVLGPRIWLNFMIMGVICFIGVYFIFGGYKIKVDGNMKKPEKATPEIKKNFALIIFCLALFIIPVILSAIAPSVVFFAKWKSGIDVLLVYSIGIVLAVLLKLGNEREVLKEQVPWSTVILVGGCGTLIAVCSSMGLGDYLAQLVSGISSPMLIPIVLTILAGLVSLVSDSTAVVFPLFFPAVAGIAAVTGFEPTKLFSCIMIGAIFAGITPVDTGGSMLMSFLAPERRPKMFNVLWVYSISLLVVVGLLSATPLIG